MNDTNTTKGRHGTWMMTLACSIITLVAIVKEDGFKLKDEPKETKWAVAATCIVLSMSAISIAAQFLMRDMFIGKMMEGGVALLACVFSAAALPAIMDPDNELALTKLSLIRDANMYFFSWGMFLMSLFVLGDFLKDMRGGDSPYIPRAWLTLTMTGLVTMVNAARMFEIEMDLKAACNVFGGLSDFCMDMEDTGAIVGMLSCNDAGFEDTDYCKRVKLALSLGTITGVVGAVWLLVGFFMSGVLGMAVDMLISLVMLVFWCAGVAYITFGDKAPALNLGNLYFFTWGNFVLSVYLAMIGMKRLRDHYTGGSDAPVEQVENEKPAEETKEKPADETKEKAVEDDAAPEDVA